MSGPLLVTGLPRTGTSWAGKMLAASGEVVYINEPMNPGHPPGHCPGVLDATVTHQFQYIDEADDDRWARAFDDTLALRYRLGAELRRNRGGYDMARAAKYVGAFTVGRLRGRRAMLDDPFALLSTGWLVRRMGCQAVVLVRDPVAVVGSWRALGWAVHFHELLEQPALVRDHLAGYVDRMRALIGSPDWLARSCLLWELAYAFVDDALRGLPGVRIVSYESLVRDPLAGFAGLYAELGLTWSERAEQAVARASSGGGSAGAHPWSLRGGLSRTAYRPMAADAALGSFRDRLSTAEIDRVRQLTAPVAARFYPTGETTLGGVEVSAVRPDSADPTSNRRA
ncbi:MAG: sulfotransferase [Geodermatophilaceae bacterium]